MYILDLYLVYLVEDIKVAGYKVGAVILQYTAFNLITTNDAHTHHGLSPKSIGIYRGCMGHLILRVMVSASVTELFLRDGKGLKMCDSTCRDSTLKVHHYINYYKVLYV